jgi:DNA-binding LacI/PurR family transcriptional regulator
MKQAVNYLTGLGHRQIALITPGLTSSDVQERIMGFHQGCFEAGIAVNPSYVLLFVHQIGGSVLEAWFDNLPAPPTAIICNSSLAFPVQHLLWSRNLKIPQDVSLIVTDDSELFQNCIPELTVIRQSLKEMGRRSLTKLMAMLRGRDDGKPEVIPNELIIRNSCKPI